MTFSRESLLKRHRQTGGITQSLQEFPWSDHLPKKEQTEVLALALEAEDSRQQEDDQAEAMVEEVHHDSQVESAYRQQRSKEQTRKAR